MKIFTITIVTILLIIGVSYGAWYVFFRPIEAPKPSVQEQVIFPTAAEIQKAESNFHNVLPESSSLSLSNMIVIEPYALADWSDQNIGGMVVFKRDAKGEWEIIAMDGGILEMQSLIQAGVPAVVAQKLLGTNRY